MEPSSSVHRCPPREAGTCGGYVQGHEAMYAPDSHGELPNAALEVRP